VKDILLNRENIIDVAGENVDVRKIVDEVIGYNRSIAGLSIEALSDPVLAHNSLDMAVDGLRNFSSTIPVGNRRLSEFPEVIRDILRDGHAGFFSWMGELSGDEKRLEKAKEQAIFRNVYHFIDYAARLGNQIPKDTLETMRKEFDAMDFSGRTFWLSRFLNGLQTSFVEVYWSEKYFSKIID